MIVAFAVAVLVALAAVAVVTQRGDRASANEPQASDGIDHARWMCPEAEPEKLPPDALAGATEAALAYFESFEEAEDQYAVAAYRGERAGLNEFYKNCVDLSPQRGKLLQKRSVEVHLAWPKMSPSASMSQGTVLVARFEDEYQVWAH